MLATIGSLLSFSLVLFLSTCRHRLLSREVPTETVQPASIAEITSAAAAAAASEEVDETEDGDDADD